MALTYHGSIGSVLCHFLKGCPPSMQERAFVWHVPGKDGWGCVFTGEDAEPGPVDAILFGTAATITAWYNSIIAAKNAGTFVTLVNDGGLTFLSCFIEQVGPLQVSPARIPGETITMRAVVQVALRRAA